MIILSFGGYKMVEDIIQDPSTPFLLKAGIMAFLRNIVGGEITDYTKMMAESREQAIDRMIGKAEQLGANAIINVRFTTSVIMQSASEILAYGTAVIVD
jgi:uncharacterized protein YbjQ (UPF0145 family)